MKNIEIKRWERIKKKMRMMLIVQKRKDRKN